MHPLSGADLATLSTVFRLGGPVAPEHRGTARAIWASALGRLPFSLAERAWMAMRAPATIPPPVFIVGHWRSGTTHLYQMMVEAGFGFVPPAATGLPWDLLLLARLAEKQIAANLPKDRFIDKVPVKLDSPQEDEVGMANMTSHSLYHGLYFPSRLREFVAEGVFLDTVPPHAVARWEQRFQYLMTKLHLHQGGRRLLIKNPTYTARVAQLARLYPQAVFIHIHRNPVDVIVSMRNFYAKLLKQFALQDYTTAPVEDVIFETYARMMAAVLDDGAALPPERFQTIRYDDFSADPMGTVERVWTPLRLDRHGIGPFGQHAPRFQAYLDAQKSFEVNRFHKDATVAQDIYARLAGSFARLGYPQPDVG